MSLNLLSFEPLGPWLSAARLPVAVVSMCPALRKKKKTSVIEIDERCGVADDVRQGGDVRNDRIPLLVVYRQTTLSVKMLIIPRTGMLNKLRSKY